MPPLFCLSLLLLSLAASKLLAAETRTDAPPAKTDLVFEEVGGLLVVEAEAFFAQTNTQKRAWHVTSAAHKPDVGRDIDEPHFADAGGGAYIEVLPDTGNDPVGPVRGESISDVPGEMAVVSYRVHFNTPGRYYIWARAFGTDGDDNTLHFGLDGAWPTNSARMHTFGGKKWTWACRHRQNKGKIFLDVAEPGAHVITVSMREDGCELDRFLLTRDENFTPADDIGPEVKLKSGALPKLSAVTERNGLLVVEMESLGATDGWQLATAAAGFTGAGYLEWTKPGQGRKAGEGVLALDFHITTPGAYQFLWRNRMPDPKNRPETPDPDGNDTWLRFATGADVPGQAALGNEWRKIAILGHPEGWTWNTQADPGKPHPLTPVCRQFAAGAHRLEISGRSLGHAIDRLVLRRLDGDAVKLPDASDEAALTALAAP